MEQSLISLATGVTTTPDKLKAYFDQVFAAEDSGDEHPVNLAHIWPIGYTRKDNAVAALRKNFVEGVDFVSFLKVQEREVGATTAEEYHLSTSCAEYFAVRANREVFEVYRNCRKALRQVLNVPKTYKQALVALLDEVERREQLEAQAALNAPKIEFADAVAVAANAIPMSAAAKYLKLPGVGRNKLFRMLRADKVVNARNEPYQQHIDAGYFEVEPQTYEAGQKGKRITGTTRVTGRGLQWLQKKYKQAA